MELSPLLEVAFGEAEFVHPGGDLLPLFAG